MIKAVKDSALWLLGEVLHVANATPPVLAKSDFYRMKDRLLRRFGTPDGFDVQHIVKECHACYGQKTITEEIRNCGVVVSVERNCRRCNGTGVYEQFWTHLLRYTIGQRQFHLPERKFYEDPHLELQRPMITGYVTHRRYPFYFSNEAFLLLALLFDRKLFAENFGRWGMSSWKVTPLVILSNFAWKAKRFHLTIEKICWRARRTFIEFRQRHCRHEFPTETSWYFDVCSKCGVERWRIYLFEPDEFPF